MSIHRYTWKTFSREMALILAAAVFVVPLYLVVTLSLKDASHVFTRPLSLPSPLHFGNYSQAWHGSGTIGLGSALINSVIITAGSVIGVVLLGSIAAFALARRPGKLSTGLYVIFLLGIILPFQIGIVPLFVIMRHLGLVPGYLGMILLYIGLYMPVGVLLYTSFIRTLPTEYEEAARVDGASLWRLYTRVVFPLLRPVTGTVAILTGVVTWNEFFVPLIFLSGSKYQTLPVAVYGFVGEYVTQWQLVFAAVVVAIVPALLFFSVAQRQLVRGFSGGIKG
jgi:raffinose/stachyose/melibiose transport system permease protein